MPDADGDAAQTHVAYLGPEASFSHQAALAVFPAANLHALPSFNSIFAALQSPSAETPPDYAILPIENSTNGSVVQVLDLLVSCATEYPDLEVCAEHYLAVHHFLFTSNYVPDAPGDFQDLPSGKKDLSSIETLYTHPQVWGQCARFLAAHLPRATERLDVSSTSQAARLVANDPSSTSAAICSSLAGELNSLHCLAENIEDEPDKNTTRFFVLRNRTRPVPTPSAVEEEVNVKALLLFTIPHTTPGSLSSALRVFAEHKFNLTRIDTRPSRQQPWHYVFFVECEEQRQLGEDYEGKLNAMVKELERVTESVRVLGSWRDMLQ
jgi:prephenate dehydratase